eukprot:6272095-Amphidinium_carterae.1
MRLLLKKGLHYLTETQFAIIRRALRDYSEGMADVNQLSYWSRFKGKTAKQILASDPELIAASMKVSERLMTVVQEKQGTKKFALPKGLKSCDVVKRDTYNLDDMTLISSEPWDSRRTKPSRLPKGVTNIHTVFTYRASADADIEKPVGRLPEKLVQTVLAELDKVVIPLGKQRTNDWDPLRPTLRSVNLGAYTTRGSGVTKQTVEWPTLVQVLHKVAKYRPKPMRIPYTSISLNKLAALRIHKDSNNSQLPSC